MQNPWYFWHVAFRWPCLRSLGSRFDAFSLLAGVAGLIPAPRDLLTSSPSAAAYAMRVADRYRDLNTGFQIQPMPRQVWRFSRMRPANLPTLRIAQAVALFTGKAPLVGRVFDKIADAVSSRAPDIATELLLTAEPDAFWHTHASLTRSLTRKRSAVIGAARRAAIASNAFCPVLLALRPGSRSQGSGCEGVLASLPPQTNRITRRYSARGKPASEAIVQGLHELAGQWCSEGRCLECPVGRHLSARGCRFV